jgi:hypothetical protein
MNSSLVQKENEKVSPARIDGSNGLALLENIKRSNLKFYSR